MVDILLMSASPLPLHFVHLARLSTDLSAAFSWIWSYDSLEALKPDLSPDHQREYQIVHAPRTFLRISDIEEAGARRFLESQIPRTSYFL